MKCAKCYSPVLENTHVCESCGAKVGRCIKCGKNSYFIDINFPQKIEYLAASVLLGLSFNYSRVKFKQCAFCKNIVQICIKCGRVFRGINKCPSCQYIHFVGTYSFIKHLKP